ncbi:hypothetical protein [Pseudomonas yamanorum]|uniref:hypothetical protein n=1 Tax=Pseudomonas yamanorum TaxID=515393 RepID=UPI001E63212E|nr:hypothetical protein [Pseudomonas yamanorum]
MNIEFQRTIYRNPALERLHGCLLELASSGVPRRNTHTVSTVIRLSHIFERYRQKGKKHRPVENIDTANPGGWF